jgi:hypothetical protein
MPDLAHGALAERSDYTRGGLPEAVTFAVKLVALVAEYVAVVSYRGLFVDYVLDYAFSEACGFTKISRFVMC